MNARVHFRLIALWLAGFSIVAHAGGQPTPGVRSATFDDAAGQWSGGFSAPVAPYVKTVVADGDERLFAFGAFEAFFDVVTSNAVLWNGTTWRALGQGIVGVVAQAVSDGRGGIYVGGSELIDGAHVVRWDGSTWTPLGALITGISDLVVDGDGVPYAYGCLQSPRAGTMSTGIVRWDGHAWIRLPGAPLCVDRLLSDEQQGIYATWSDTLWHWIPDRAGWDMTAVLRRDNTAIEFLTVRSSGITYAAHYLDDGKRILLRLDGDGEEVVPLPEGVDFRQLAFDAVGTLHVLGVAGFELGGELGSPVLFRQQGDGWTEIALPAGEINSLEGGAHIHVLGRMTDEQGAASPIARLEGDMWTYWTTPGRGSSIPIRSLYSDSDGQVYAWFTSYFDARLGGSAGPLAVWSGTDWSTVPGSERFDSLVDAEDGVLYAVERNGVDIWAWTGTSWERQPFSAVPCTGGNAGPLLPSLIVRDPAGMMYGAVRCAYDLAVVARWDGDRWTELGDVRSPNSGQGAGITSMVFDDQHHLYIGGRFLSAGGVGAKSIARWDGRSWSPLGAGLDVEWDITGQVQTMLWDDGRLYVGGGIDRAGDTPVRYAVVWDGASWSSMGDGFNAPVMRMVGDGNGRVYAAGDFIWSGTTLVNRVAVWDGERWQALGAGVAGSRVSDMALDGDGKLWLAGDFFAAGGRPSSHVASWIPGPAPVTLENPPGVQSIAIYPNPARESLSLDLGIEEEGRYVVTLYDLLGRRIRIVHDGPLRPGAFSIPLSLHDAPSGMLLLVVEGASGARMFPIVHVR